MTKHYCDSCGDQIANDYMDEHYINMSSKKSPHLVPRKRDCIFCQDCFNIIEDCIEKLIGEK